MARSDARRETTAWNHVRAVVLLPVTNTVFIPALILAYARDVHVNWLAQSRATELLGAGAGALASILGVALVARAIALFVRRGDGTLAPWDPARRLITEGVYGHSRNPLKTGLFLVLTSECVLLGSLALTAWTALFVAANVAYIRLLEEPALRKRFGRRYDEYCAAVPRWLPRPVRARDVLVRLVLARSPGNDAEKRS